MSDSSAKIVFHKHKNILMLFFLIIAQFERNDSHSHKDKTGAGS